MLWNIEWQDHYKLRIRKFVVESGHGLF